MRLRDAARPSAQRRDRYGRRMSTRLDACDRLARSDDASAAAHRCARSPRDADVHLGHDRHAERRAAVASQHGRTPRRQSAHAHRLTPDDRVLSSLPLYHINGQCIATLTPARFRRQHRACRIASASRNGGRWSSAIGRTWLNVVPTIIAYLLNGPDARRRSSARLSRACASAARASAPLPPSSIAAFEERFGIACIEAMGLTETRVGGVHQSARPRRGASIGTPGLPLGVRGARGRRDGSVLRRTTNAARSSCAATT